eukprot:16452342-Heterocapsa_arctica.AAC.1
MDDYIFYINVDNDMPAVIQAARGLPLHHRLHVIADVDVEDVLVHLGGVERQLTIPVARPTLQAMVLRLGIIGVEAGGRVTICFIVAHRWGIIVPQPRRGGVRGLPPVVHKEAALMDSRLQGVLDLEKATRLTALCVLTTRQEPVGHPLELVLVGEHGVALAHRDGQPQPTTVVLQVEGGGGFLQGPT